MIRNWVQEKIVLPISDLITNQEVAKYLKLMLKSQYWTRQQLDEFQNERLRALIKHAYDHVPFYRDEMKALDLTPADIQTKEDLEKLPIIDKNRIRKEGIERFTADNIPVGQRIRCSSSGSTGQPFTYYITPRSYSVNMACNLRGWYNFGWRLGDKYVKISQNPRKSRLKKLQDRITGNLYVPTADLSEQHVQSILQSIERYKPLVIRSYPDPLFLMAQYRLTHANEFRWSPNVITTTGNLLHSHVRETIEEAFGCELFDAYACEGNANMFECPTHECYHTSEEYGITEVVDDSGKKVTTGMGRVVTTDLWNYAHPFIRYDVQDRVEMAGKPCSCGRVHLPIKRILGRNNELLEAPSGRKYTVHHFTVFFESTVTPELKDSIDQFQIIQHKDSSTTILLVVNDKYDDNIGQYIANYWSKEFGAPVEIKLVERIPVMANNKCRFIIVE